MIFSLEILVRSLVYLPRFKRFNTTLGLGVSFYIVDPFDAGPFVLPAPFT